MTSYTVINLTTTTPPNAPAQNDSYLVLTGDVGTVWAGKENHVSRWVAQSPAHWSSLPLQGGDTVFDEATSITWMFDANSGLLFPVSGARLASEAFTGQYDGFVPIFGKGFTSLALPDTTTITIAHGASIDFARQVRLRGFAFKTSGGNKAFQLPFWDATNLLRCEVDSTSISVISNFDASPYRGLFELTYCHPS